MSETSEDRTEAASAKRLQNARDEGDVPLSRELPTFLAVAAGALALSAQLSSGPAPVTAWFAAALANTGGDTGAAAHAAVGGVVRAILPATLAATAASAAATLLQSGFLFRLEALRPDPFRVSPLKGLKRLFGIETLGGAAKAIVKLAILAGAFAVALAHVLPLLAAAPFWQPQQLYWRLLNSCTGLVLVLLGAQAAIAGADILVVRLRYARRMRMSRHDLREEHRDSEGNPQIKQRLRQLARARARRRMMAAVPRASVIVTNPTHFAVALNYERGGRGAPRVVAKGADEVAGRIRDLAREHRIPIVANPPLARALFRIEIDTEIPPEHFKAVAEIIAYVWRLRSQRGRL